MQDLAATSATRFLQDARVERLLGSVLRIAAAMTKRVSGEKGDYSLRRVAPVPYQYTTGLGVP